MNNTLSRATRGFAIALAAFCLPALAQETPASEEAGDANVRASIVQTEAVITGIDLENRQVTLKGPMGNTTTVHAKEELVDLEDVTVGDKLVLTYLSALEGELREPTEEEMANPWVVLEDSGEGVVDGEPVAGGARLVRAVCTIEGMNRLLGTVTLLDPNGRAHLLEGVEPEKMSGVELGQTVVVVYREALALTLEMVTAEQDAAAE
ncbi:hypothetical protein EY643_10040 [Halioglobus maricola]|uniref:Copper-binding protein n=1 Tax=Halioglobus maricola TaxID=2601894 RepID=A0A5P9NKD6_9GAMM|nr:hypothetical protein [Halioglobus maricola]QFU75975.1 hypothetical protein EY643_10040 [Halioglobus maricola]